MGRRGMSVMAMWCSFRRSLRSHAAPVIGLALLLGCSPPERPGGAIAPLPIAPIAPAAAPTMPRPGPPEPGYDPIAVNAACIDCHRAIGEENAASFHGQAHVDPIYQTALAIEPLPFCRACHAPEADPRQPVSAALGALGVTCTSCHWSQGRVLAGLASAGRAADPHRGLVAAPVVRIEAFAGPSACAGCHEFHFPDGRARARPELMQSTISEHRQSPFAEVGCGSCHMPTVKTVAGGHRSHAFASSRDPRTLRATLDVKAERTSAGVRLQITPAAIGHAMPTGDLFRRLRIEVEQIGPDMNVVAVKRRFLARHFESRPTITSLRRTVVRDDRPGGADVGHETQVIEFAFPDLAPGHFFGWRIELERVLHPAPGGDEKAVVAHRQVIGEGKL